MKTTPSENTVSPKAVKLMPDKFREYDGAITGGQTSGYMLRRLLDASPQTIDAGEVSPMAGHLSKVFRPTGYWAG